jgi:hypothetical protein
MELTRRQKREIAQKQGDLRAVLSTGEGRRFVVWLLERSCVLAANASLSGLVEGRRALGLELIDALHAVDPLAFPNMLAEETKRRMRDTVDKPEESDNAD